MIRFGWKFTKVPKKWTTFGKFECRICPVIQKKNRSFRNKEGLKRHHRLHIGLTVNLFF